MNIPKIERGTSQKRGVPVLFGLSWVAYGLLRVRPYGLARGIGEGERAVTAFDAHKVRTAFDERVSHRAFADTTHDMEGLCSAATARATIRL